MLKRKPSERRRPAKASQQPRDRLTEIRAEIEDVQRASEAKPREARAPRTAEDSRNMERATAAQTARLSALLMPEAKPAAPDGQETRRRARSLARGAGRTIKD